MLENWLTAGHIDLDIIRDRDRGRLVLGADLDPRLLTGALKRIRQTKADERQRKRRGAAQSLRLVRELVVRLRRR